MTHALRIAAFASVVILNFACAHEPPTVDYTLARTAVQSAKDHDAPRFAPALWHSAEENFRKAELAYQEKEFEAAQSFFKEAKQFAERAENSARLQKLKSGDEAQ